MSAKHKLEKLREPDGSEPFIVADDPGSIRLGIAWARTKAASLRTDAACYAREASEFRKFQALVRSRGGDVADDSLNCPNHPELQTAAQVDELVYTLLDQARLYERLIDAFRETSIALGFEVTEESKSGVDEREGIGSFRGLAAGPPPRPPRLCRPTRSLAFLSGLLDEGPHVSGDAARAETYDGEG